MTNRPDEFQDKRSTPLIELANVAEESFSMATQINVLRQTPTPEALQLIPESLARKYVVVPLTIEDNTLRVAMADTDDVLAIGALSAKTKKRIEPVPATVADVNEAIDFNYRSFGEIADQVSHVEGHSDADIVEVIAVEEADAWLEPEEPVLVVIANGDAKAYPIQIMTWHEIVNDQVGDRPLTITFCPLCNTGIAFEREFDQYVLDFGTTGRLRYSNLIMYDRQTETWWQQASGKGLAGEFAGRQLSFYPVIMVSWKDFKTAYPEGLILSRDTGYNRPYGNNPYPGYDKINSKPGLFRGPETPDKLPALARVLTIELENEAVAYPFNVLQDEHVINDSFAGEDIVIFWESGTSSALDAPTVAGGKDVGAANAFKREIDGRTLSFVWDGNAIIDEQTGSDWNLFGIAEEGPLSGTYLEPLIAINHFWFSWSAYKPDTRIYQP